MDRFRRETGTDLVQVPEIRILSQPVRSGQSAALMRGLAEASGELIVSMDADRQYDPADIPKMLDMMTGFDMVCGVRKSRADGLLRLLCSRIANMFRNLVTADSTRDSGCIFRIMRRECISAFLPAQGKLYGCEFFFHPLFARKRGFRVGEVEVQHRTRSGGKSHYRLIRGRIGRGIMACFKARRIAKNSG